MKKREKFLKGARKSIKLQNFAYKRYFMLVRKRKGPKKEYYGCENLRQFIEVIQLPYHPLRSIKETICPFFSNKLLAHWTCDQKSLLFSLKINRNFVLNYNLDKFLFGQFLTIIVDLDLIQKFDYLPQIFHPGYFAELGIREA